jgi:hypothetical protein
LKPDWQDYLPLWLAVLLLVMACLLVPTAVHASGSCFRGIINTDKAYHVIGIGAATAITTEVTGNEAVGMGVGVALSAWREHYKMVTPGFRCSYVSILADGLGLYLGHRITLSSRGNDVTFTVNVPLN